MNNLSEARDWVNANPGAVKQYCRGYLLATNHSEPSKDDLWSADIARCLFEEGLVELVQLRYREFDYSYRMIARREPAVKRYGFWDKIPSKWQRREP